MSTLDQFYGRAHPMTQGEMLRKVYSNNPQSMPASLLPGSRATSPRMEKTRQLPRLPPTPRRRSKTAEPRGPQPGPDGLISRYPCRPPASAPAGLR
mmetsp:Transcript_34748/g.61040  ORF Transcript_34748/g.61040 Transcript_34748/m.61040 type:complete len:96 (+) Transcript_34748:3-290(+)